MCIYIYIYLCPQTDAQSCVRKGAWQGRALAHAREGAETLGLMAAY